MNKLKTLNKVPEPNFEDNRLNNDIYIDKTKHIYNLLNTRGHYFLSRPRRFGKTMLVKTMIDLLKNKKDLFKDTYIYNQWDWKQRPVVFISFGRNNNNLENSLPTEEIELVINTYKEKYNIEIDTTKTLGTQFYTLINKIYKKTNSPVTLLVDEYDKPLLDSISKGKFQDTREFMKDFYINFKQLANDGIVRNTLLLVLEDLAKTKYFLV